MLYVSASTLPSSIASAQEHIQEDIVPSCICSCVDIYCTFPYILFSQHLLHIPVYDLVLTSIVPSCICSCVVMYCTFLYMFLC